MKLTVLGSSSAGNCYLLHNDTECLIIEAGIPFKEVKKALNFDVGKIVGVIATHGHGDHSKYIDDYLYNGIPTFKPYESEMERQVRAYGGFVIKSFPLVHNVPCHGFLITHKEIGRLLFATDTEYIKYRFENLNHILVEANYSPDLLSSEMIKKRHVLTGHMSIDTACGFLEANNNKGLRSVVLIHLSNGSSDEGNFIEKAKKIVSCPVYAADKGMEIDLNLMPF